MSSVPRHSPWFLCTGPRAYSIQFPPASAALVPWCLSLPPVSAWLLHPPRLLSNTSPKQTLTYGKTKLFHLNFAVPSGISWWEWIKQETTCTPRRCWELCCPRRGSAQAPELNSSFTHLLLLPMSRGAVMACSPSFSI